MSMNLVVLLYLVASVCFIQALKGLSHPKTSILGNAFGMGGMAIAVLTTFGLIATLAQQMQLDAVQAGQVLVLQKKHRRLTQPAVFVIVQAVEKAQVLAHPLPGFIGNRMLGQNALAPPTGQ